MKITKLVLLLVCGVFLCHCGDETTANMVARQQDVDRERQQLYEGQNKQIVGIYQGSTPTSDIFLVVEASTISGGSSTAGPSAVPVTTLAGSLTISPKLSLSSNNDRVQYSYPFNNGSYDPRGTSKTTAGGRLALSTTETNGNAESLNCDADVSHVLTCTWSITSNAKFTLKPSSAAALKRLSAESSSDIVYTGQNDNLNILIEFDSGVVSRDGSQIPQPTILGNLVFFDKSANKTAPTAGDSQAKYGFRSGTYDILHGQITLTMDDTSQVTMVCKILKQGESLRCVWLTKVKQVFTVTRTIRR